MSCNIAKNNQIGNVICYGYFGCCMVNFRDVSKPKQAKLGIKWDNSFWDIALCFFVLVFAFVYVIYAYGKCHNCTSNVYCLHCKTGFKV